MTLGELVLGERLEPGQPADLSARECVRVRCVVGQRAGFGRRAGHAAASSLSWLSFSDASVDAASTRRPVATRCWKARNATSCESVTMPVGAPARLDQAVERRAGCFRGPDDEQLGVRQGGREPCLRPRRSPAGSARSARPSRLSARSPTSTVRAERAGGGGGRLGQHDRRARSASTAAARTA